MKRSTFGYVGALTMGLCGILTVFGPSAETHAIPAVLREMGADRHLWLDVNTVNHSRDPELTVVRYQLEYDGLPVVGRQIVVWFHPGGRIELVDADIDQAWFEPSDMDADLSPDEAVDAARADINDPGSFDSDGMAVWAMGDAKPVLVHHVVHKDPSGDEFDVYVNADTGAVEGTFGVDIVDN